MRIINCAKCGKIIEARSPRTKYCPSCAYEVRQERAKAFYEALKAARGEPIKPKELKKPIEPKKRKWELAEPRIIKCGHCGREVVLTDARSHNRKYCDDCKKIVYAELTKKAHDAYKDRKNPEGKRLCARCGVVLEKRRGGQKYCDDCRAAARLERDAARKRKQKQREGWRIGELPEKKKKKPRVSQIDSIQRAAHEAGMSYGKYVAMLAMKKGKKVRA